MRTAYSVGNGKKGFHVDTVSFIKPDFPAIDKKDIQYWATQLNTNKENFTDTFIKPLLKSPTKKEILQVAKKYDKLWMIRGKDSDKDGTKKAINDIQQFYKIDSFLIFKKPSIEFDMVVVDIYNSLRIQVISSLGDTVEYRSQFFEPLGQPVVRYHKGNYLSSTKVFNLAANTSDIKLLPPGSLTALALDVNNLTEFYIKWYLETQLF